MNKVLLYFGCIEDKGHFLWEHEGWHHYPHILARNLIPTIEPRLLEVIDGSFVPYPDSTEGKYKESIIPPVRIVAWHDYSVDQRPGSNSALIGCGFESAEEMLDAAKVKFPSVMNRQPRPVPHEQFPLPSAFKKTADSLGTASGA